MALHRRSICLLLAFLELFSGTAWSLQTHGVYDFCDRTLTIKSPVWGLASSIILKPTRSGSYQNNRNCSMVVKPNLPSNGLVVSVRTIDLRPPAGMFDRTDADTLTIRYKNGGYYQDKVFLNDNSLMPKKDYDSEERKSFTSTADVTITFNTSAKSHFSTSIVEGFELIITVVQPSPCGASQFRCKSGSLCIAEELKCDGHNHCGDRSDQLDCGDTSGDRSNYDRHTDDNKMSGVIIFAIVMGVLVFCFLIWFTFFKKCEGACEGGGSYGSSSTYTGTRAMSTYPASSGGGGGSSSYTGGSAAGGYSASSTTYAGSSAAGCTSAY